jgi:hypothetical protein
MDPFRDIHDQEMDSRLTMRTLLWVIAGTVAIALIIWWVST